MGQKLRALLIGVGRTADLSGTLWEPVERRRDRRSDRDRLLADLERVKGDLARAHQKLVRSAEHA